MELTCHGERYHECNGPKSLQDMKTAAGKDWWTVARQLTRKDDANFNLHYFEFGNENLT